MIIIKNVDTIAWAYAGQEIGAADQYTIQGYEVVAFQVDQTLLANIANGKAVINNGILDLNPTDGAAFLQSVLESTTVAATDAVSTTSSSWIVIPGMTITPVAGVYFVSFSCKINNSASNGLSFVRLSAASLGVAGTERVHRGTSNTNAACQAVVTVDGAQAIAAEWMRLGSNSNLIDDRILTILKIG